MKRVYVSSTQKNNMSLLQKIKAIFSKALLLLILFISEASMAQNKTDSTATDSVLLKQIEEQMNQNQPVPQQTRSSLSFNPDIGVIGDFQSSYISKGDKNFDMYLNETELSLQAVVDPYLRADFFLSLPAEAPHDSPRQHVPIRLDHLQGSPRSAERHEEEGWSWLAPGSFLARHHDAGTLLLARSQTQRHDRLRCRRLSGFIDSVLRRAGKSSGLFRAQYQDTSLALFVSHIKH